MAFEKGDKVLWVHQPHGGYGYQIEVPAVVMSVTAKRVRIAAKLANGSEKFVTVRPENLLLNGTLKMQPAPEAA